MTFCLVEFLLTATKAVVPPLMDPVLGYRLCRGRKGSNGRWQTCSVVLERPSWRR